MLDTGKGTLKELCQYSPPKCKYWTLMRLFRSGPWNDAVLVTQMTHEVLCWLPPPADGVLHLSGDKTRQDKRRRKHHWSHFSHENDYALYTYDSTPKLKQAVIDLYFLGE